MKQKARYIGANGDRNYIHNGIYQVKIETRKKIIVISAPKMPPKGYSCMKLLLQEWDFDVEENCDNCDNRLTKCPCEWVLP